MPDLNDFINQVAPDSKTELVFEEDLPVAGGTFECQECGQEVYSAFFKHKEERLTWTCSRGHISSVPFK